MRGVSLGSIAALCLLIPSALMAQTTAPPEPPKEVQPAETRLKFYGFLRTDLIFDDSRMDSAQSPLFVQSEPDGAENRENFTLHPRLTRFGIDFSGPQIAALGSARAGGKLELDFQNGGRESRAVPRYRHAYLSLAWKTTTVIVGQTSDIISPLLPSVNNDTVMWNTGNLGDRRPQVRATYQSTGTGLQWTLAGGIGLTGAVDQLDSDSDGVRDGEAAGVPNLQGRLGLSYPIGTRRLAAGLWAHRADMQTATAIASETSFPGHSIGADVEVPLGKQFVARGELWAGSNLSDVRGAIGQSINRGTGQGIDSQGGWFEVGGDITSRYALFGGAAVDAPDEEALPSGARSQNSAWFIVNRFNARPIVIGADYLRWETAYVGLPNGTDNRINVYVIYTF